MQIDRRAFTAGILAAGASATLGGRAFAQTTRALSPQSAAMEAIRAYAEAHRRWFGLPGLTLGVTSPSGFSSVIHAGFSNADSRSPITGETLFQIGSISKSFSAALLHQLAAEGRFKLSDRIVSLLPGTPLPSASPVTVQHLLDHVAGIPGDAPLFVEGGLWTAYAPGEHWHYSNTAYELLGLLTEHFGGKPLDRLFHEKILSPLGMSRSRGAIVGADRLLYAQGYEEADTMAPFVRGTPLAPAAWVDVTGAAGCVASTAADMNLYLASLASAVRGKGGLGLPPQAGLAFATHAVPSDSEEMRYGNGLMHVSADGRPYLHHTGGMVSFTSSFHLDVGNGIGSFASTTLNAFSGYRPRKLTLFAVQALAAAEAGAPLPQPPALESPVERPADYAGFYGSGDRRFEVRPGPRLSVIASGKEAPLEPIEPDLFGTLHPGFRDFLIKFDRSAGSIAAVLWGPETFVREGTAFKPQPSDPKLARLAGRYVNDSPWNGSVVIVERGGKLWAGTSTPLIPAGKNLWRVGEESWTPERASFADFIDGRPQTFVFSGVPFSRHDI